MTSIVRLIRDKMRGIPKDVPLDYSQITDDIYICATDQVSPRKDYIVGRDADCGDDFGTH